MKRRDWKAGMDLLQKRETLDYPLNDTPQFSPSSTTVLGDIRSYTTFISSAAEYCLVFRPINTSYATTDCLCRLPEQAPEVRTFDAWTTMCVLQAQECPVFFRDQTDFVTQWIQLDQQWPVASITNILHVRVR
jgi:hypothetical protein